MGSAGDMIFFKLLGQPFLLLGSAERAYDIFEKRSLNYSDRPRLPMFNEVLVTSLYQWLVVFTRDQDGLHVGNGFPPIRIGVEGPPSFVP